MRAEGSIEVGLHTEVNNILHSVTYVQFFRVSLKRMTSSNKVIDVVVQSQTCNHARTPVMRSSLLRYAVSNASPRMPLRCHCTTECPKNVDVGRKPSGANDPSMRRVSYNPKVIPGVYVQSFVTCHERNVEIQSAIFLGCWMHRQRCPRG